MNGERIWLIMEPVADPGGGGAPGAPPPLQTTFFLVIGKICTIRGCYLLLAPPTPTPFTEILDPPLGAPRLHPKFLSMVIQLHEDQHGQVRLNSNLSEPFTIVNGVKQGCVLAPTLFSILFRVMLQQAMEDLDDDVAVYTHYRFDGSLFNLRRQQAHTKTREQLF